MERSQCSQSTILVNGDGREVASRVGNNAQDEGHRGKDRGIKTHDTTSTKRESRHVEELFLFDVDM